jgi:ABC-2 type transport system ATP-binding protein
VVIIDHGRVVSEGPPRELRKRIGSAVVALEFADEHAAVRAQRQLGAQFPAAQRNGPIVRLASEAGSSSVVGAARALTGADDPVAVQIREPSLDDVFLALTSSAARTSQQGDAA